MQGEIKSKPSPRIVVDQIAGAKLINADPTGAELKGASSQGQVMEKIRIFIASGFFLVLFASGSCLFQVGDLFSQWELPDGVFISEMGAQMQRGWWEFTT